MTETNIGTHAQNAWIAVGDEGLASAFPFPQFALTLAIGKKLVGGVSEGDWVLVADSAGNALRIGRVLRLRSDLDRTTIYFDQAIDCLAEATLAAAGLSSPSSGSVGRLQWSDFVDAVLKLTGKPLDEIPLIDTQAYIRELLQLAVMDDLLGPANGPDEQIVEMSVRDRYLVGKLAPQQRGEAGGIEGLEGPLGVEDEEEPDDLEVHTGRHDPGAEFDGTTGKVDAEAEAAEEIDAASNQSLIPSSLGFTFCVDGDVDQIEVDARWGQYTRIYDHEHTKTVNRKIKDADGNVVESRQEEVKAKVWQREPCGGVITLNLTEGAISHQAPDKAHPEVRIQGTIRGKNANGDRLVTVFLVNAQEEPDENKDSGWLFQPEIHVRAVSDTKDPAIFRRRLALTGIGDDAERDALEMIYRKQVEFAVGHGVAVHAQTETDDPERATSVRTVVMPQYEVPVTETPGLRPEDRPAMRKMVEDGYLDMEALAAMERDDLVAALSILADDYGEWIKEQAARIGADVVGHDEQAKTALKRCDEIKKRLEEGIAVLADTSDDRALKAFRFANTAMAKQRIHSLYALSRRRGEGKDLAEFEVRKNRSWRPFQLAFILLSLPSLADPTHKDRSKPVEACADLLWFPTGGGKTEAYLGVAAFAMAIRRLQGKLGGFDGSRGLGVIMRYTLRLLTLQQFQRASTLICAMELLRQEAIESGDESLGQTPFTIGLWVGNKVTPGTTSDSHRAIKDIRDPDKFDAGGTSPAQLTSCPWCGCEVSDKRDIEVDTFLKRTSIYCGDKKGRCEFSRGKSSKKAHPGIPVVVVDEEIYHWPPSMMIATVDKFALMAWRGEVRTLFGRATIECPRHGLLWPESDCTGRHPASKGTPRSEPRPIMPLRPPDLIIQDEFHLISGPLGTMVGLYETAIDELSGWKFDDLTIKPKIVASTATVRKAPEQVNNVFMRRVAVFPPHGLDVADNFFSMQRPIEQIPGRRYLGVCSPGSSRPAMLIRVYTAFLTASQALFDRFGQAADPYLTAVGYFNSLRELGGMKRLAEDDVQTRSYRVQMSLVDRPGLAQRSVSNIRELTSRVSSRDIPKYLDQLEVKFKAKFDPAKGKYVTEWEEGEARAIDVVLATNMLSVGVDVNRLGLMVVNGQPKGTAEYIQATSRVGRSSPGLVCTVLTWARPRDLSHYETFEHYHATFYKHVEAQSVTPFSPRAMDRGLTGALLSLVRLENDVFNPNVGAGALDKPGKPEIVRAADIIGDRAWSVSQEAAIKTLASDELKERIDEWADEAGKGGRTLAYEKKGPKKDTMVALLRKPGIQAWDNFTVPMSMREVEPGVRLVMNTSRYGGGSPAWTPPPIGGDDPEEGDA
ncbi:DISARM system helicase DrmA [Tsuneonella sp. HG094]